MRPGFKTCLQVIFIDIIMSTNAFYRLIIDLQKAFVDAKSYRRTFLTQKKNLSIDVKIILSQRQSDFNVPYCISCTIGTFQEVLSKFCNDQACSRKAEPFGFELQSSFGSWLGAEFPALWLQLQLRLYGSHGAEFPALAPAPRLWLLESRFIT